MASGDIAKKARNPSRRRCLIRHQTFGAKWGAYQRRVGLVWQRFLNAVGSSNKTLHLHKGYYHDLLNDIGRDRVLNDIGNWIENA